MSGCGDMDYGWLCMERWSDMGYEWLWCNDPNLDFDY